MVQETEIIMYQDLSADPAVHVLTLASKFRNALLEVNDMKHETADSAAMMNETFFVLYVVLEG